MVQAINDADHCLNCVKYIQTILSNTLDLTKLEAGKLQLQNIEMFLYKDIVSPSMTMLVRFLMFESMWFLSYFFNNYIFVAAKSQTVSKLRWIVIRGSKLSQICSDFHRHVTLHIEIYFCCDMFNLLIFLEDQV